MPNRSIPASNEYSEAANPLKVIFARRLSDEVRFQGFQCDDPGRAGTDAGFDGMGTVNTVSNPREHTPR
jgi:hypothetical protein